MTTETYSLSAIPDVIEAHAKVTVAHAKVTVAHARVTVTLQYSNARPLTRSSQLLYRYRTLFWHNCTKIEAIRKHPHYEAPQGCTQLYTIIPCQYCNL